jgi:hypothetical protein
MRRPSILALNGDKLLGMDIKLVIMGTKAALSVMSSGVVKN